MDYRLYILNIITAITDMLTAATAIITFFIGARYFGYWWIQLFAFIPLLLYFSRKIISKKEVEESNARS